MLAASRLLVLAPLITLLSGVMSTTVGISADESIIMSRDGKDVGYFDIYLKANGMPFDRPVGKGELSFKIRTRKIPEYGKTVEAECRLYGQLKGQAGSFHFSTTTDGLWHVLNKCNCHSGVGLICKHNTPGLKDKEHRIGCITPSDDNKCFPQN